MLPSLSALSVVGPKLSLNVVGAKLSLSQDFACREALDGGFKIVDSNGQSLAYVYAHADPRDAATAKSR